MTQHPAIRAAPRIGIDALHYGQSILVSRSNRNTAASRRVANALWRQRVAAMLVCAPLAPRQSGKAT